MAPEVFLYPSILTDRYYFMQTTKKQWDFEKETGEQIDPGDCIGTLSKDAFSSLFSRYLTWEMSSSEQCPMEYLTASSL